MRDQRETPDWALHTIPDYAVEEKCRCGKPAGHKVEETSGPDSFHPLTTYLCCSCFTALMNYDCATYPYDADDQLGGWPIASPTPSDNFSEGVIDRRRHL